MIFQKSKRSRTYRRRRRGDRGEADRAGGMDEVEHYGGTMMQALKTVLPIKEKENAKVKKRLRLLLRPGDGRRNSFIIIWKRIRKRERRLMAALLDDPLFWTMNWSDKKLNITCHGDTRVGRTACARRGIRAGVSKSGSCGKQSEKEGDLFIQQEQKTCDHAFLQGL